MLIGWNINWGDTCKSPPECAPMRKVGLFMIFLVVLMTSLQ